MVGLIVPILIELQKNSQFKDKNYNCAAAACFDNKILCIDIYMSHKSSLKDLKILSPSKSLKKNSLLRFAKIFIGSIQQNESSHTRLQKKKKNPNSYSLLQKTNKVA